MEPVNPENEQALRSALTRARERLDALARDLRGIDDELEALGSERARISLLQTACAALEELSAMGAAGLFWDGRGEREGDDHVRRVRSRVDVFQKRLGEIEDRRQDTIEEIERQYESAGFLEDDILELERQEEERKLEWIVEREDIAFPARAGVMPWTRGGEDDERLRKALATSLLLGLLLGWVFPLIPLPLPELREPVEVPERLTRLLQERPRTPPPVTPRETRPEEKPEPVEKLVAEAEATPRPGPQQAPKQAAGSKGILAFREQFSGLADNRSVAALGLKARINRAGEAASGATTRSLVTTQASGSSGGINLAALSRSGGNGGGQQLEGVEVARATSTIVAIGGGGGAGAQGLGGDGPPLGRTDEEIQIVFDRHKSALYRLYNRELRSDPTLKGQMVLRIRIEPDGSVSLCELQTTDMNAPQLSVQVVERVRTFDFGAKEGIAAVTILYPIDFLPAT